MSDSKCLICGILGTLLLGGALRADIITLDSGRTLEGKVEVLKADDPADGSVRLLTRYGSVTFPAHKVVRIEFKETLEERVTAAVESLLESEEPPDAKVPRYMALARECEEAGWRSMARDLYSHVLTLDPDHFPARERLGYQLVDGEWKTEDEVMVARGLVKHKGQWVHPDEIRIDEAERYWDQLQKKVNGLVKQMGSSSASRRAKAYDQLIQLRDEIPGIVKAADQARRYFEEFHRRRVAQGSVVTEIRATVAELGRPIPTFETTLATGSVFAPPTFVQIQIPELSVSSVETTVEVPVIWEDEEDR